jgi:DNA-binding PadR family transcriptional regulator
VAALLSEGGHGYDLRKAIGEMTDDAVSVDAGGLYRTLRRMEEEGFVTSKWVEGDAGPQKREYELTAAGYELAEDWIEHLEERSRLASLMASRLAEALAATGVEGPATKDTSGEEEE